MRWSPVDFTRSHKPRRTGNAPNRSAKMLQTIKSLVTLTHLAGPISAVKMTAHQSQAVSFGEAVLPVVPKQQEEDTEGSSAGRRMNKGAGREVFKAALYMPWTSPQLPQHQAGVRVAVANKQRRKIELKFSSWTKALGLRRQWGSMVTAWNPQNFDVG